MPEEQAASPLKESDIVIFLDARASGPYTRSQRGRTGGTHVPMSVDLSGRTVLRARGAALLSVAIIFAAIIACGGDKNSGQTPTPSATPESSATSASVVMTTETPTPSPTVVATVRAATPEVAAAAGKAYFPPPPPRSGAPPANSAGIARVRAPSLGVDHYVEIDHIIDNAMESPRDGEYAVGFYPDFDKPGAGGNSIFSAHET